MSPRSHDRSSDDVSPVVYYPHVEKTDDVANRDAPGPAAPQLCVPVVTIRQAIGASFIRYSTGPAGLPWL